MKIVFTQLLLATLLSLLFLIFDQLLRKKASARGRFLCGMILTVLFLIPVRLPLIQIEVSEKELAEERLPFLGEEIGDDFLFWENAVQTASPDQTTEPKPVTPTASKTEVIVFFYLLGTFFMLCRMAYRYCRTVKAVFRCGRAPTKQESADFESLCRQMKLRRTPRLLVCPAHKLSSPLMFGIFRQTVFISEQLPKEEKSLLLGHELTHCKRRDPLCKLGLALLSCAYWFHPLLWLFIQAMNRLCEESCDEAFLASKNEEEKKHYCKLLVFAAAETGIKHPLTFTAFKGGKTQMKQRIQNILSHKNHKITVIFVAVLMVAALLSVSIYAAVTPANDSGEETTADVYFFSEEEIQKKNEEIVKNNLEWFGIDLSEEVANPENSVTYRTDGFVRAGTYNGTDAMLTPDGEPIIYLALDGQLWKLDYTPGLTENGVGINYIPNGDGTGTVEYVDMKTVLDEFIYNFSWASLRKEEGYPAENGSDYEAFYRDLKAFCEEHADEDIGSPFPFYGPSLKFFTTLYNRAGVEIPQ